MSLLVARALWGLGWFACNVAIPTALGVGVAAYVVIRAGQGFARSWMKSP